MELWDLASLVQDRLDASLPVFWKRESFTESGNFTSVPRWHRLERVLTPADPKEQAEEKSFARFDRVFVAACGYSFKFDGLLGRKPLTRNAVATPKLRCSKCDKKLEKARAR